MALRPTIFKACLHISDLDRHVYADFPLTLARHPSETDERMMVRLAAFALHADETLSFGRGLSATDEADLEQYTLSGEISLWIAVGQPSEDLLRKSCSRAHTVIVYSYGTMNSTALWWQKIAPKLQRFEHLHVYQIPYEASTALAAMTQSNMDLQCFIEEGQLSISDSRSHLQIQPIALKPRR